MNNSIIMPLAPLARMLVWRSKSPMREDRPGYAGLYIDPAETGVTIVAADEMRLGTWTIPEAHGVPYRVFIPYSLALKTMAVGLASADDAAIAIIEPPANIMSIIPNGDNVADRARKTMINWAEAAHDIAIDRKTIPIMFKYSHRGLKRPDFEHFAWKKTFDTEQGSEAKLQLDPLLVRSFYSISPHRRENKNWQITAASQGEGKPDIALLVSPRVPHFRGALAQTMPDDPA